MLSCSQSILLAVISSEGKAQILPSLNFIFSEAYIPLKEHHGLEVAGASVCKASLSNSSTVGKSLEDRHTMGHTFGTLKVRLKNDG